MLAKLVILTFIYVWYNFIQTIIQQGAMDAFEKAYGNSTKTRIESEGFKRIQDIPCLIIWGEKDSLIPIDVYYGKFKEKLPKANCKKIEGAGHAPFVEKTVQHTN